MRVPKFRSISSILFLAGSSATGSGHSLSPPWPTDDPEVACIMNNLDWSNSVVAQTMMRGYPIFGDHGLNVSNGSGSPTNVSAHLDLEPTFELDVENFIAYLESEESQIAPSNTIMTHQFERGSTRGRGGNRIPTGIDIGLAYRREPLYLESTAFNLLYGYDSQPRGSTYKRDALRFVEEHGGNPSYSIVQTQGPATLRHPCINHYYDPTIIRFSQAYLDAIDELPSDFDYQAYLRFGTRFGHGYVSSLEFSHTEIQIATKVYVTLGSKYYTASETNCQDPPFNMLSYDDFGYMGGSCGILKNTLTDDQRSKLETFESNIVWMVLKNTNAPTTSPTRTPTVSSSPTVTSSPTSSSPTSAPVSLSTSAAATSTCFISKLPVALALALFSFFPQ